MEREFWSHTSYTGKFLETGQTIFTGGFETAKWGDFGARRIRFTTIASIEHRPSASFLERLPIRFLE